MTCWTTSVLFLITVIQTIAVVSGRALPDDVEKINVHLVPHTHDDVGWLKTVDEYYYGADNGIQHASVQYILDTVVDELLKNKERKFIYVEIAFFTRWWNEQDDDTKQKVKDLVSSGQLEFINGGWCMNDEASTHYNAIIDQMSIGLRFIANNFGVYPTVGWHIDPFGHSSEQAALFSLMGFDSFFFGRIDYADKALRLNKSEMEIIWQGSQSLGSASDIFTGVLYNHYDPPTGFCFDIKCDSPPIQDDRNLFDYNVDERVDEFIKYSLEQAKHFKTSNIMMTMGSDFQYEDAREWFKNLDKLIKYVNENGTVNVMYSTPSIYTKYINEEDANIKWTVKTDDFFPYADDPWNFWTGYFTSRPGLKGYVRKCNSHLQACKQLEAVHNGFEDSGLSSIKLQQAMGVAQHHDAVSGTEKQHVADDYAKRLHIGEVECRAVMSAAFNIMAVKGGPSNVNFTFCEYLNISICPVSETGEFHLLIYNLLGRPWNGQIRVPLLNESVAITDPNGKPVTVQIVPITEVTKKIRLARNTSAAVEGVFEVFDIPPLGYSIYTAKSTNTKFTRRSRVDAVQDDVTVSNDFYSVLFDGTTGQVKQITNIISGITSGVNQQFYWYNSSTGNNKNSSQASGAYIFRPNSSEVFPVNGNNNKAEVSVVSGDVVTEVHQIFSPWVSQVVRLYKNMPAIEFEYTIGPIPISDGLGKEVISRFQTDLKSEATWYTDANGRDMQKRVRNFRPTWKYNNTAPVAGNYYPVNSRIYIRDESKGVQFTVLNDRSQGGSSLLDGSLELMVHRRILVDDNRGVGEPLNETGQNGDGLIIRGKHVVLLDDLMNSTYFQRMLAEKLMLEPELAFVKSSDNSDTNYNVQYSGLYNVLPDNIHLLTFEYLEHNKILLRLDHQFEATDPTPNLITPVTVSLKGLFKGLEILDVTELALGANVALSDIKKLQWTAADGNNVPTKITACSVDKGPDFNVKLNPMQICTFNVTVLHSNKRPYY